MMFEPVFARMRFLEFDKIYLFFFTTNSTIQESTYVIVWKEFLLLRIELPVCVLSFCTLKAVDTGSSRIASVPTASFCNMTWVCLSHGTMHVRRGFVCSTRVSSKNHAATT